MATRTDQDRGAETSAQKLLWSPRVRGIVSALLAFHVAAVFIAPWSGPPPASGLSATISRWIRPYTDATDVNHGYRFFAPNPGPSHLVRYELELRDGSLKGGLLPDLEVHWPRQLYHRHLMIAETVSNQTAGLFPEPIPPNQFPGYATMTAAQREQLRADYLTAGRIHNEVKGRLIIPLAQRIMLDHDAEAVRLWSVEHRIPFRQSYLDGARLTDEDFYEERWLGRYQRR